MSVFKSLSSYLVSSSSMTMSFQSIQIIQNHIRPKDSSIYPRMNMIKKLFHTRRQQLPPPERINLRSFLNKLSIQHVQFSHSLLTKLISFRPINSKLKCLNGLKRMFLSPPNYWCQRLFERKFTRTRWSRRTMWKVPGNVASRRSTYCLARRSHVSNRSTGVLL